MCCPQRWSSCAFCYGFVMATKYVTCFWRPDCCISLLPKTCALLVVRASVAILYTAAACVSIASQEPFFFATMFCNLLFAIYSVAINVTYSDVAVVIRSWVTHSNYVNKKWAEGVWSHGPCAARAGGVWWTVQTSKSRPTFCKPCIACWTGSYTHAPFPCTAHRHVYTTDSQSVCGSLVKRKSASAISLSWFGSRTPMPSSCFSAKCAENSCRSGKGQKGAGQARSAHQGHRFQAQGQRQCRPNRHC